MNWLAQFQITRREAKLLSLTILLATCGSLGLDIHLASLPHIMAYMETGETEMQQSVTLFVLGVSISMLIYGPLSDKYGRKPIVMIGLSIAMIACFLAVGTDTIGMFLLLRFIQGLGSGVCWGLGRVIAADVMQDERLASIGSYFTLFISLSPLLAPGIGGHMQHWFGWQANFILLGSIIGLVLICFIFLFEETNQHPQEDAFSLLNIFKNYGFLLNHGIFLGASLVSGLGMAANIVYLTTSSFIFQNHFHTSAIMFGWLTAIVGISSIVGKLISPFFIIKYKNQKTLMVAIFLLCFSGVLLSFLTYLEVVNIPLLLLCVSLSTMSFAFNGSITMSMALSPFLKNRGSAGGLFGAFQLLISFVFTAIMSGFHSPGVYTLAISYVVLGILSFIVYRQMIVTNIQRF